MFIRVKIDGPVHDPARHTYWFGPFAECASILDIDGDGKLDIAAGRNYYIAPGWKKYSDYRDGATHNQVAIAWMLHSDPPVLPIIAGSQPAQLQENLAALDLSLSAEQMCRLDSAGNPVIGQSWLR